jgi:hypothetical protein
MQFQIDPAKIFLIDAPASCPMPKPKPSTQTTGFMLVNKDGANIRTYDAKKPAQAAIKAYYSYLRAHKQNWTQKLLDSAKHEHQLRAHLKSHDREHKMDSILAMTRAPPGIVRLRKLGDNKVRTYIVRYEPDLAPNKHQIDRGIFKTAVAQLWTGPEPVEALQIS